MLASRRRTCNLGNMYENYTNFSYIVYNDIEPMTQERIHEYWHP